MGSLTGPSDPLTAYIAQVYVVCGVSLVTVPCVAVPVMLAWICYTITTTIVSNILCSLDMNAICKKLCGSCCLLSDANKL